MMLGVTEWFRDVLVDLCFVDAYVLYTRLLRLEFCFTGLRYGYEHVFPEPAYLIKPL